MLTFFWEGRFIIAVILLLIVLIFLQYTNFKVLVYQLMLQARRLAKYAILNGGAEQEAWVVERLFEILPIQIKIFVKREQLVIVVRKLYAVAKVYLAAECIK